MPLKHPRPRCTRLRVQAVAPHLKLHCGCYLPRSALYLRELSVRGRKSRGPEGSPAVHERPGIPLIFEKIYLSLFFKTNFHFASHGLRIFPPRAAPRRSRGSAPLIHEIRFGLFFTFFNFGVQYGDLRPGAARGGLASLQVFSVFHFLHNFSHCPLNTCIKFII